MSTPANLLHDSPLPAEITPSSPISPARIFLWSVRRELWDNRSLYLAPAIVAVLVLLGFFFGPFGLRNLSHLALPESAGDRFAVLVPYELASGLIMATTLLVSVFYSVDALYAERRDRSILFWKSLPVSDLTTVLAKASIPLFVLPLIAFTLTVLTHLIMALATSVVMLRQGNPLAPLLSQLALPHLWLLLLGHLLAVAALWYAPFYAWFLLVSAWATRSPLLVAFLPPLALAALEAIVFHTTQIGSALAHRLAHGNVTTNPDLFASNTLNTPELWLGLLVAAGFLAAAVRLRRYKGTL